MLDLLKHRHAARCCWTAMPSCVATIWLPIWQAVAGRWSGATIHLLAEDYGEDFFARCGSKSSTAALFSRPDGLPHRPFDTRRWRTVPAAGVTFTGRCALGRIFVISHGPPRFVSRVTSGVRVPSRYRRTWRYRPAYLFTAAAPP